MEFSEKPKLPRHRRVILLLLVLLVLGGYLTVMFNLQIVHGADYRRQSVSQIVRSTTVEYSSVLISCPAKASEIVTTP